MATTIVLDPEIETRLEQLIQHGMDELEDGYFGAIEAERVRLGESSTRSLDAVIADLDLDD